MCDVCYGRKVGVYMCDVCYGRKVGVRMCVCVRNKFPDTPSLYVHVRTQTIHNPVSMYL